MRRRELLRAALGALGIIAVGSEPWERLLHAIDRPARIDPQTIGHLEQITTTLSGLEREVIAPATLLGTVMGHLDTLTWFLNASPPPSGQHQLYSLAAETAALAGWLKWDMGDFGGAGRYFQSAMRAAKEAGDKPLGAYLVGCLACQPFYREDPEVRLRSLREQIDGFAAADASVHTRAWLFTLEAGAHALSGDADRFKRASDQAEALLQHPDAGSPRRRPRATFFDHAYFVEESAAGWLRLGRPDAARAVLQSELDDARGRIRLWMLADLAVAHASAGDATEAAVYGSRALTGAQSGGIEPILVSLRGLATDLGRHGHIPAVQEFTEQLASHS
jgi:hypothetical protein